MQKNKDISLSLVSTTYGDKTTHTIKTKTEEVKFTSSVAKAVVANSAVIKDLKDILSEIKEYKQSTSYTQGKVDAYKDIINKFSTCSDLKDVYSVIAALKEKMISLSNEK